MAQVVEFLRRLRQELPFHTTVHVMSADVLVTAWNQGVGIIHDIDCTDYVEP